MKKQTKYWISDLVWQAAYEKGRAFKRLQEGRADDDAILKAEEAYIAAKEMAEDFDTWHRANRLESHTGNDFKPFKVVCVDSGNTQLVRGCVYDVIAVEACFYHLDGFPEAQYHRDRFARIEEDPEQGRWLEARVSRLETRLRQIEMGGSKCENT